MSWPILNYLLLVLGWFPLLSSAQVGDVTRVHDPSVIQCNGTFYVFSTGPGIAVRTSTDLFHWRYIGHLLPSRPAWISEAEPLAGRSLWAPDISQVDGEYRLYYVASVFGTTSSVIGLTVNKTLDKSSQDYKWIDRGKVIGTPAHNTWNAIDPCAFEDGDGHCWMVLGSCWSGLKLIALDRTTGLLSDSQRQPISIAAYPPVDIIEEGYIRRHGDYFYLWESVDRCCRGVNSTYKILIGRSRDVRGPYLDRDAMPLLRGGGTLVLSSYDNIRGPGSCAIADNGGDEYLLHHEYDANNSGMPTLQVRQLFWGADGWPVAGEPISRSVFQKAAPTDSVAGEWKMRTNFEDSGSIHLNPDFSISPGPGTWKLANRRIVMTISLASGERTVEYNLSDDGSFFVGRNSEGAVITGIKLKKV